MASLYIVVRNSAGQYRYFLCHGKIYSQYEYISRYTAYIPTVDSLQVTTIVLTACCIELTIVNISVYLSSTFQNGIERILNWMYCTCCQNI